MSGNYLGSVILQVFITFESSLEQASQTVDAYSRIGKDIRRKDLIKSRSAESKLASASSHVADFNTRNKLLIQKLLKQGHQYHKICKTFSKFYRRCNDLISKLQIGLKSLLRQGLSEPEFYGDLLDLIFFQRSSLK